MFAVIDPYHQTVVSDQLGLDALFEELVSAGVIQPEPVPTEDWTVANRYAAEAA